MEIIALVGYAAAVFIGISLGLIGGGGSILTVPVLVYVLGIDPVLATAYSLFVVGSTSLVSNWWITKLLWYLQFLLSSRCFSPGNLLFRFFPIPYLFWENWLLPRV